MNTAGNIVKIAEHFWIFEENGVRSFLFEGEESAMLVDTGFGTLPIREMVAKLTGLPVFLVNTHTDPDHTGCNRDFAPVYMHPAEMEHYKDRLPEGCSMEDVRPLWEGEILDLGRWKFEVILAPGHTPGSIMLLEREKRMLISGDSIQDGSIYMFGRGRNIQAYQCSLEKLAVMREDFDTIWPSHGSYPLAGAVIQGILKGVQELVERKLPEEEPPHPMPCKKYTCDAASFLYHFE